MRSSRRIVVVIARNPLWKWLTGNMENGWSSRLQKAQCSGYVEVLRRSWWSKAWLTFDIFM